MPTKKKAVKKPAKKAAKPVEKKLNLPEQGETPTQDQIDEMVERLNEVHGKVITHSMFGDDHLASIEAMVEVLENDMDDDEIAQREEDGEWTESVAYHARDARNWLDGQSDEVDLADGWPLREDA